METLNNYSINYANEAAAEVEAERFSFFKAPITNIRPYKSITLLNAYNYITGHYAQPQTELLRSTQDPKERRIHKSTAFDYCTFSGIFNTRNSKYLISHSGLLCLDFDHLDNVEALFHRLLEDFYLETKLLFRSPSGNGLKWIVPINPFKHRLGAFTLAEAHSRNFEAVSNYIQHKYNIEVDKSGSDVSRACFLSHDPEAYINPKYQLKL